MIATRRLAVAALCLILSATLRAQPPQPDAQPPVYAPMESSLPAPFYEQPIMPGEEIISEPSWCESPYRGSSWSFEIDFIPMTSHVSELEFGDWDADASLGLRLGLGYEGASGFGTRAQLWAFGQDVNTGIADIELGASTFYWDFFKRFYIEDAELALGGGLAGGHLEYRFPDFGDDATFTGGGLSIFGEGFYPFWRFKKVDIGTVGRARVTLLSGEWDDDGTPFIDDTEHDQMTLIELAWGLELRRRFGRHEDKYWYVSIVPELHRWESASLPDTVDPGFDGTAIRFGVGW